MRFLQAEALNMMNYLFGETDLPVGTLFQAAAPTPDLFVLAYATGSATEVTVGTHPGYSRTQIVLATEMDISDSGTEIVAANDADIAGPINSDAGAWPEIDRVQFSRVSTVGDTTATNFVGGVFELVTPRIIQPGSPLTFVNGELVIRIPYFNAA